NLSKKIVQIQKTGSYEELDRLVQLTPPGLLELMKINGLGGKKIHTLWKVAGITSPEELIQACEENKLTVLKGFGKKTQENIIELIEFYFESKDQFMYAEAEYEADKIIRFLENNKDVEKVSETGEMRRKMPIIRQIDILVQLKDKKGLDKVLADAELVLNINEGSVSSAIMEIPVVFHQADGDKWGAELLRTTGSEEHINQLDKKSFAKAFSEEDIYAKNGWPYIIPEMRENRNEKEMAEAVAAENIVTNDDLLGCLHNHSTYSDGSGTLEQMAQACIDAGLEYFGIADHSQSAFYAHGMKPRKVLQQWKEIDKINKKLAPFKIFKGIESDILNDGLLDYDEEILKEFDYVVASVHSNLKMKEEDANKRLIKAIENPYTTILGHATGRLLLMRKGYPIDYKKIIDACAANSVVIEVNANPRRLDMDWKWLNYAQQKDVLISINPDAHDMDEILNMQYGVYMARKGGIAKDMVLNTFPLEKIETFFKNKK
ncbi:MAG: PHP domain-containing protein, partial [Bacteroidia bacterium]